MDDHTRERTGTRAGLGDQAPPDTVVEGEHMLSQLVAHLREHRTRLREEWAERIQQAHLLSAMTPQEMTTNCPISISFWRSTAFRLSWPVIRTILSITGKE